jgi:uncharacterized membrane protein
VIERDAFLEALLKVWTGSLASGVEGIAGLLIALAALQATVQAILLFVRGWQASDRAQEPQTEMIRLRLGRWLALALEFELGADILRTAIAPTWTEIGQLAAIATIRTLLNYFLQQEIDRAARRQPDMALQAHTPPIGPHEEPIRRIDRVLR